MNSALTLLHDPFASTCAVLPSLCTQGLLAKVMLQLLQHLRNRLAAATSRTAPQLEHGGSSSNTCSSSSGASSHGADASSSNNRSQQHEAGTGGSSCSTNDVLPAREALDAAGQLLLELAAHAPKGVQQHAMCEGAAADTASSATRGAAGVLAAAGQRCALLEDLVRAEISAERLGSRRSLDGTVRNLCNYLAAETSVVAKRWPWGPLIGPIIAARDVTSPQALQLFGLLVSLLKLNSHAMPPADAIRHLSQRAVCYAACGLLNTASDASAALAESCAMQPSSLLQPAASGAAAGPVASSTMVSAADPGAAGNDSSSSSTAAALPWLVLLGRCCLLSSEQLQTEYAQLHSAQPSSEQQAVAEAQHSSEPPQEGSRCETLMLDVVMPCASGVERAVEWWLYTAERSAQLAALGHDAQHLLEFITGLPGPAIHAAAVCDSNTEEAAAAVAGLVQQLRTVGQALSVFAIPHACNNPWCSNVSGPCEAQLVGGRSCLCAGCREARYCSKARQKQHWKQHKPVCKALAARHAS